MALAPTFLLTLLLLLLFFASRRYASLYFLACVDDDDNELIVLETIHHFVEVLDRYFGNVCELDLVSNLAMVAISASKALTTAS